MSTVAVAALLVASMLAIGAAVTVADVRALAGRRALLAVSVVVNVVVLPGLAVVLVQAAGLRAEAALGVVLAAAAPGGGTGALLTLYARGDLAVSAAVQGVHAPLGMISVPVWAAAAGYDAIPPGAGGVVLLGGGLFAQVLPFAAGMWLLHRRPGAARRVHRVARRCADVLLAGLVAYFVVTSADRLGELGWAAAGVIAAVVTAGLASVAVPWVGTAGERRAVAMTATVRNLSLALFVADTMAPTVVLTLLAYGLLMYGLSVPVAVWMARASAG